MKQFRAVRGLPAWVLLGSACLYTCHTHADTALTLAEAMEHTLANNPALQAFPLREKALRGQNQADTLRPELEAGVEVENLAGSGDYRSTDAMDTTLSLSSVFELGGKHQARLAVADAKLGQLQAEQDIATLNAGGDVARQFLDALVAQERVALLREAEQLAKHTATAIKHRADIGGGSPADVLRAQALQAQATLATQQAASAARNSRMLLAALWGDTTPDFLTVSGHLLDVGSQEPAAALYERASRNPHILKLASDTRLKAAETRLAQAQARTDIRWSAGIRQFNDTDDTALVAGVSVPLFTGRRNAGHLQAAQAEHDEAALAETVQQQQLKARLQALCDQRQQALDTIHTLQDTVIPLLAQAMHVTQSATSLGQAGYEEWRSTRQEWLSARLALLEAADQAHRIRIDIEQLTAEPLHNSAATDNTTPRNAQD